MNTIFLRRMTIILLGQFKPLEKIYRDFHSEQVEFYNERQRENFRG